MSYEPPPEHAQRSDVFRVSIIEGVRLVVRLGYYGKRLLADFMIQLELELGGVWYPVARVDCCGGTIHRHQYIKSSGKDVLDHLKWADIPTTDRISVDALLCEGYDWAYELMFDEWETLVRKWRNG